MKINKSIIIRILAITLILLMFLINIENYIPKFYNYLPIVWIMSIIYEIYKTKKYIKNIPDNELRIRNMNDNYFNILPFITGILICTFSILGFLISDSDKTPIILLFILGFVSIFHGLITIPNAIIKFDNGNLNFENGTVKKNIKIGEIDTFQITENQINFSKDNENKLIFQHLELNEAEIEKTKNFLKKYLK
jgi:hypothetical protein